jgi:hypothetical protein
LFETQRFEDVERKSPSQVWKGEFHARFSTHKHRVIVVSARRSDPPFPTSFYINHLTRFEVALFCITQRRWPFRLSPFHGVPDRSLVINVLSQNLGRKTQRFDLVVSLELYESTKVNVTKLSMQLLHFRRRIFTQITNLANNLLCLYFVGCAKQVSNLLN